MSVEIEHKYLTSNDSYKEMAVSSQRISQGYLSRDKERTVRIRTKDDKGYITVKTKNVGDARNEFEYEIPFADAAALLKVCLPPVIQKTRYLVSFGDFLWEIDEFEGALEGVTLAEIELPDSNTRYPLPSFVGENVTGKPEYYNSNIHRLAKGYSNEGQD